MNVKRKKIINLIMAFLLLAGTTAGCSKSGSTASGYVSVPTTVSAEFSAEDLDSTWDNTNATEITLANDKISVSGSGAVAAGRGLTIGAGGVYVVTGSLTNGQIVVNSSDNNTVRIVLAGAVLTNASTAPIYVQNAAKTIITLAPNTNNTVTGGSAYSPSDASGGEPDAALFSHDDLIINGTGTLIVNGNYKHGIVCNDDLKFVSGTISVTAVGDGLKGRDCVAIRDGNITLTTGSDGIQSGKDTDARTGWVYVGNGNIRINSGQDGIQAQTAVSILDGNISVTSGGGSQKGVDQSVGPGSNLAPTKTAANADIESAKGIKAGTDITIAGGMVAIDGADDAIHSNDCITINGGNITIDSGDDGIHSDTTLVINNGDITVNKSYEAMESSSITINSGNIHLMANDDGINTSGGSDGSSLNGRPGQNQFDAADGSKLTIAGGYIYVNAQGDGVDVNGEWVMSGGQLIVDRPTNDGNGALDCNGTFAVNCGLLVAAGSAGMAEAPDESSTQASLKLNLSVQPAGTMVRIANDKGAPILTFTPLKSYASVVVSSPELAVGSVYTIHTGGSCDGTQEDGLYTGGTYIPGSEAGRVQLSGAVTTYGQSGSLAAGNPGGPAVQGGPGGHNPGTKPLL